MDKIPKAVKQENHIENFHKTYVTFLFPGFLLIASLYKQRKTIYKNILFHTIKYVLLCLNYLKN